MRTTRTGPHLLLVMSLMLGLVACSDPLVFPYEYDTIPGIPVIHISTVNAVPIVSKGSYRTATIRVDGAGVYDDFSGPVQVRGRGNSTWYYGMKEGKKPFRLRLPQADELLGLPAARNWVLLANYLDTSLMGNAIAFQVAHMLEMPFTHTMIPVEVVVNGEYLGSYLFTEHKEVAPNRIDIGKDGLLLELDDNMDEDYIFRSVGGYWLPVMIANPDLSDLPSDDAVAAVSKIRSDFAALERAIAGYERGSEPLLRLLDPVSFAKYMLVYSLALNFELNYPKSVYMYRIDKGPYHMGPIWDFDWAYGYRDDLRQPFVLPWGAVLPTPSFVGGRFFRDVFEHDAFRNAFVAEWTAFYEYSFPILLEFIDEYGERIRETYARDFDRWHATPEQRLRSGDIDSELERIRWWMRERARFIDAYVTGL